MGVCELAFCTAIVAVGKFRLGLGIEALQTLAFLAIVFGNQATLYALRERRGVWSWSMPSRWLVLSSVADVAIASTLAAGGIVMTPLPVVDRGGRARGGGCVGVGRERREIPGLQPSQDFLAARYEQAASRLPTFSRPRVFFARESAKH